MAQRTDQRIDEWMGVLLRTGVMLAAGVVLVGGVVYLTRHHVPATDYRTFQGEPEDLRSVPGILRGAATLRGRGLIQLGLLILIATPIARVGYSFAAFLVQRDWLYVCVTVIVLGLLCYSLLGAHGGV